MNCFKKEEESIDPALLEKYPLNVDELSDLMQLKSNEALERIRTKYVSVEEIARKLNSNLIDGLKDNPIEISEREKIFGRNEIPPKPPKTFLRLAFEALHDTTLIVLMICAILSIGLSFYHPPGTTAAEDQKQEIYEQNLEWVEGVAILIAVIVVVTVTAFNDWRKEKQFRGLQSRIEKENLATVVRNGQVVQINVKDLVVGDVCCIKYGDLLPADGLVIQSNDLKIDESSLTGETDLIKKNTDKNLIVLSGTHVMEGSGKFLVCAVGVHSQCGIIYVLLGATKDDPKKKQKKISEKSASEMNNLSKSKVAPEPDDDLKKDKKPESDKDEKGSGLHRSVLQTKLTSLAIQIGYAGTIAAVFTFIILCIRLAVDEFAIKKMTWSNSYIKYLVSYLIQGITVLVVAVPEGLPLAVTLSLAYAVKKMTKDNNLVRHLDACETMGSATTICSDKTGTLTTNRMTVVQCYVGEKFSKKLPSKNEVNDNLKRLIADAISINSNYTSKLEAPKQQGDLPKQLGNKTECGLLGFVNHLGESYEDIRRQHPVESFVKVNTFNSARKMMSTIIKNNKYGYRMYAKGASEIVLQKCAFMLDAEGRPVPLNSSKIDSIIKNVVENMAMDGLRTICVAYRDFVPVDDKATGLDINLAYYDETPDWDDEDSTVRNLTCLCLVGIEDPVRDEVPEAIRKCQSSGVVVRMITGDNINTATSIATKCGIVKPGDNFLILESKDFNARIRDSNGEVSQALLDKVWPKLRVLARSTPQDKYILVNGIVESKISKNREVVAVTGDGTNDGPALKRADVGFAMGIQGTDVAKEASDIILTDDNFSSIVKAMMWGRNVYDSIAKFLQFQLTANLTAGILSIVCAGTIRAVPLKAIQMLWVNLVMDTLGSLSLATEPPTEQLLKRKPYGRTKPILSPGLIKMIVGHGVYQLIIIFALVWGIEDWLMVESVVKYNDINRLKENNQHFTMIFNSFVLMTLFNEINARKLFDERNVLHNIHKNPFFYLIWIGCFIAQIFIVTFGSILFSVVPLDIHQWMWCILFGFGTLLWGQVLITIPTIWVERLIEKLSCCRKKYENSNEIETSSIDGYKNGTYNNGESHSHQDLSKVIWLRGINRLNNQFTVISAFQQRLNEYYELPSNNNLKSLSAKSLLSIRDLNRNNSINNSTNLK